MLLRLGGKLVEYGLPLGLVALPAGQEVGHADAAVRAHEPEGHLAVVELAHEVRARDVREVGRLLRNDAPEGASRGLNHLSQNAWAAPGLG